MTRTVLVVDDDEDVRSLVVLQLSLDGHEVSDCATVPEALAYLDVSRPDVVLTDLNFGSDTGERIVLRCLESGLPVVLMTASVSRGDLANDMVDRITVLQKPFMLADLSEAVATASAP